jgi:hypothetical protein
MKKRVGLAVIAVFSENKIDSIVDGKWPLYLGK